MMQSRVDRNHINREYAFANSEMRGTGSCTMRSFFDNLSVSLSTFMVGRYGFDDLSRGLIIGSMFLFVLSMFGLDILSPIALIMLAAAMLRTFSRNIDRRMAENVSYLEFSKKPRAWWDNLNDRWINRKTKAYIKCPHCKKTFSVPKGKGSVRVTCPYCHEQSVHKV